MSNNNPVVNDKDETTLQILSDKYCRMILHVIKETAKSAFQISVECDIELSMVYRKLHLLQRAELVYAIFKVRPDGKKIFLYKTRIRQVRSMFDGDHLEVQRILVNGI